MKLAKPRFAPCIASTVAVLLTASLLLTTPLAGAQSVSTDQQQDQGSGSIQVEPAAVQNQIHELPDSPGAVRAKADGPPALSGQEPAAPQSPAQDSPAQQSPEKDQTSQQPGAAQPSEQQTPSQQPAVQREPTQPTGSQQKNQQGEPVGTAAAERVRTTGVAASKPAGTAIAPAKQRRTRAIFIKVAILAGAGAAIGTSLALAKASPSKPPGSH